MSVEYIVEGKIITQTEGNHLTYAKENISHNSEISVDQKGDETGESYNPAQTVNPNDKPVNIIDVSLNLFFDGTQNNKTNTELGKDNDNSNHVDDSYTNDYSNVARGFDAIDPAAENQVSWYIEGIGTEDGESESIPFTTKPNNKGIPIGTGPRGIPAKVTKGCIKGAEALKKYASKDINLKINVYGFSRGAAAARHFLHVATTSVQVFENSEGIFAPSPYDEDPLKDAIKISKKDPQTDTNGYFGACLLFWNIKPKKISFIFAGLYDTVASFGVNHRGGYLIDGDTKQLGLDAVSKVSFTLQMASDDEYRDNFDLTNINSAPLGLQFTLPGVHSDIGGCYVDKDKNKKAIFQELGNGGKNCEKFRDILIEEGWYDPGELTIVKEIPSVPSFFKNYILMGTKYPYNRYDRIPLNIMFHSSKQFEVKYKSTGEKDHEITDVFLNTVYGQLINYLKACADVRDDCIKKNTSGDYLNNLNALNYLNFINFEDLKTLRREYLHWSASVIDFGYSPRVETVSRSKDRKRNIQTG